MLYCLLSSLVSVASTTIVSVQTQQSPSGDHIVSSYLLLRDGELVSTEAETSADPTAATLAIWDDESGGTAPFVFTITPGAGGQVEAHLLTPDLSMQIPAGCLDSSCVVVLSSSMPGKDYGVIIDTFGGELSTISPTVSSFLGGVMPWGAWIQIVKEQL